MGLASKKVPTEAEAQYLSNLVMKYKVQSIL